MKAALVYKFEEYSSLPPLYYNFSDKENKWK